MRISFSTPRANSVTALVPGNNSGIRAAKRDLFADSLGSDLTSRRYFRSVSFVRCSRVSGIAGRDDSRPNTARLEAVPFPVYERPFLRHWTSLALSGRARVGTLARTLF